MNEEWTEEEKILFVETFLKLCSLHPDKSRIESYNAMFFYVQYEHREPLLRRLDPTKFAENFCYNEKPNTNRFMRSFLEYVHSRNLDLAARFSEKLDCGEKGNCDFLPPSGYENFLRWRRKVGNERAAEYLNYLATSPLKSEYQILVKNLAESDPDILSELALNGLSKQVLIDTKKMEWLKEVFVNSVKAGRVDRLVNLHRTAISYVADLFDLDAYDLARILETESVRFELKLIVGVHCGNKKPAQFGQTLEIMNAKDPQKTRKLFAQFIGDNSQVLLSQAGRALNDIEPMELSIVQLQKVIENLNYSTMVNILSIDHEESPNVQHDSKELTTKMTLAGYLMFKKPQLFPQLFYDIQGPFVIPQMPLLMLIERFKLLAEMDFKRFVSLVNSPYPNYTRTQLIAIIEGLPEGVQKKLLDMTVNYWVKRHFGENTLRDKPKSVYLFLLINYNAMDRAEKEEILEDIRTLPDEDFNALIQAFRDTKKNGLWFVKISNPGIDMDNTAFGAMYRYFKQSGDSHKVSLLKTGSGNYFANVDLLREHFNIDIDLYQWGAYSKPLDPREMDDIVQALKKLDPISRAKLSGITLADQASIDGVGSTALGFYESFENIVIFRERHYFLFQHPYIRLKHLNFFEEIITHETWHHVFSSLNPNEIQLFLRCAGFRQNNFFRAELSEPVEPRETTSTYNINHQEEFAEHGLHYQKDGQNLRRRAFAALQRGDPYLVLEYLFFKYVPAPTRGKEYYYDEELPSDSPRLNIYPKINIETVRSETLSLFETKKIDEEKRDFIMGRLAELEEFSKHQKVPTIN